MSLDNTDTKDVLTMISDERNYVSQTVIRIAVIGDVCVGKTTLIMSLGGKEIGKNHLTRQTSIREEKNKTRLIPYILFTHSVNPNLTFTEYLSAEEGSAGEQYLKDIQYKMYDVFLLVSSSVFSEKEMKIAKALQEKKCFVILVRSNFDLVTGAQKTDSHRSLTERIRNCKYENAILHMMNCKDMTDQGFAGMINSMCNKLPQNKKIFLALTLEKPLKLLLRVRYLMMIEQVWKVALSNSVHRPYDKETIVKESLFYLNCFALTAKDLKQYAKESKINYSGLIQSINIPIPDATEDYTMDDFVAKCLSERDISQIEQIRTDLRAVSFTIHDPEGFVSTYMTLHVILQEIYESASRVYLK